MTVGLTVNLLTQCMPSLTQCFTHSVLEMIYLIPDVVHSWPRHELSLRTLVLHRKCCHIPQASSRNSTAHHGKIVQILQHTAASHSWLNCCSIT